MRSISNGVHHRQDGYRSIVKLVSSNHTITEANIVVGGFSYDSRVVEGEGFQVGTAIADQIQVVLDNATGIYDRSYLGEEFAVSISCVNISTGTQDSWYQLGLFTVTEVDESDSATTTMVLQDRMVKLDAIATFTENTLYDNLYGLLSALGITLVTNYTNPLNKWSVSTTANENGITVRDVVRGCALLLGRNARFTNDGKLEFTNLGSSVATLNPSHRYGSRLGELRHLGGVEVRDDDGTILFSRNLHNNDTNRIIIEPSSSVIFDLLGGIEGVVTGFNACVSGGSSYYPLSFTIDKDYYPCEIVAMNWWEIQTWDTVTYQDKQNNSYPIIVTSLASVLNGRTSMTSTAEEENRVLPTQTDETRATTQRLEESTNIAYQRATTAYESALSAMPKYGTNTQAGSTTAKTVDISNFTLSSGARVSILFANENTAASPTLNVSGTGAKQIVTSEGVPITSANVADATWGQNSLVTFIYDGTYWRIDDAAALTKIDHVLAQDIVGDNGWINLKGGEFVFSDADTGDSIGFNDGILNLTGLINSSKIQGEDLNISGEGYVDGYTPTPGEMVIVPKYVYQLKTKDAVYIVTDDNLNETAYPYKYVRVLTEIQKASLAETLASLNVDFDPVSGLMVDAIPFGGYGRIFTAKSGASAFAFQTSYDDSAQEEYTELLINGPNPKVEVNGNDPLDVVGEVNVDGNLYADNIGVNRYGVDGTETTVSVASGTSVGSITSFTLTRGVWLLHVYARFASNATGRRLICLSTAAADAGSGSWNRSAANAVNGTYTYLHINTFWEVESSSQRIYVNGYQNSGSALSTLVTYGAIRIR